MVLSGNDNQVYITTSGFTPFIYQLYLELQTTLSMEAMKVYLIILKEKSWKTVIGKSKQINNKSMVKLKA